MLKIEPEIGLLNVRLFRTTGHHRDCSIIEVFGDLHEGDRVVIRGAERLNTGMAVDIQEESSTGSKTLSRATN